MTKTPFKIVITGPESTGKSSLAAALAKHYNSIWLPEYAREYIDSLQREYTAKDIENIAMEQIRREKELLNYADRFLFCDTDPLVCHIWYKVKYGEESKTISKLLKEANYDLILLCDIDIEWAYDPMREHPDKREWLFEMYGSELKTFNKESHLISGQNDNRIQMAVDIINRKFMQQ